MTDERKEPTFWEDVGETFARDIAEIARSAVGLNDAQVQVLYARLEPKNQKMVRRGLKTAHRLAAATVEKLGDGYHIVISKRVADEFLEGIIEAIEKNPDGTLTEEAADEAAKKAVATAVSETYFAFGRLLHLNQGGQMICLGDNVPKPRMDRGKVQPVAGIVEVTIPDAAKAGIRRCPFCFGEGHVFPGTPEKPTARAEAPTAATPATPPPLPAKSPMQVKANVFREHPELKTEWFTLRLKLTTKQLALVDLYDLFLDESEVPFLIESIRNCVQATAEVGEEKGNALLLQDLNGLIGPGDNRRHLVNAELKVRQLAGGAKKLDNTAVAATADWFEGKSAKERAAAAVARAQGGHADGPQVFRLIPAIAGFIWRLFFRSSLLGLFFLLLAVVGPLAGVAQYASEGKFEHVRTVAVVAIGLGWFTGLVLIACGAILFGIGKAGAKLMGQSGPKSLATLRNWTFSSVTWYSFVFGIVYLFAAMPLFLVGALVILCGFFAAGRIGGWYGVNQRMRKLAFSAALVVAVCLGIGHKWPGLTSGTLAFVHDWTTIDLRPMSDNDSLLLNQKEALRDTLDRMADLQLGGYTDEQKAQRQQLEKDIALLKSGKYRAEKIGLTQKEPPVIKAVADAKEAIKASLAQSDEKPEQKSAQASAATTTTTRKQRLEALLKEVQEAQK